MCNATAALGAQSAGAAASTVGAWYAGVEAKNQQNAAADLSALNAKVAEMGADAAMRSGLRRESQHRMQVGVMKSRQVASMAANGVDLASGSAQSVLNSTDTLGEIDANAIHADAVAAAFGYKTQAVNYRNDATMRRAAAGGISPGMSALTTLLDQGSRVASSWYGLNKSGALDRTGERPYNYHGDSDGSSFSRSGADVRARR